MELSKEWLEQYKQVKDLLVSPVNFSELFNSEECRGKKAFFVKYGYCEFYDR